MTVPPTYATHGLRSIMALPKLLTRDQFREGVFARDMHQCVARGMWMRDCTVPQRCSAPAVDAHHILERKLWSDGGYYPDNGASVCGAHHIEAEQTLISCDDLREWCGIAKAMLPEHMYEDQAYDKWGNPILPNGQRMRGELFDDESVQKILAPVLHLFTARIKYPRTFHAPWSPGVTKDDRVISGGDLDTLLAQDLVITIKKDGENTTMYRDGIHARSLEYSAHDSRDWVKTLHAKIAHEIPNGWRICGENVYAKHSIHYKKLASYFQVFSIWDGLRCLSWLDTVQYAHMLGLHTVPRVSIDGCFVDSPDAKFRRHSRSELEHLGEVLRKNGWFGEECEGYVARTAEEFQYGAFRKSVMKYVRANHVQSHGHWMRSMVVPNQVKT